MADRTRSRNVKDTGYVRVKVPGHPEADARGWAYEHRVVAHDTWGPIPAGHQVHHRNHDRADNRPSNLDIVSIPEHGEHHQKFDRERMLTLYESGMSTVAVAAELRINAATVSRVVREMGGQMRTISTAKRVAIDDMHLRRLHAIPNIRVPAIAEALGVGQAVVRRRMRELGLPPFTPGRPK